MPQMTEERTSKRPPEAVERVAKAIYMSAVNSAREKVAGKTLPIEKIKAVFEDAFSTSDREAAIIIFALVDDIVSDFFRERLTGKPLMELSKHSLKATACSPALIAKSSYWRAWNGFASTSTGS